MVPILTCGLVRSNLAFATVSSWDLGSCAGRCRSSDGPAGRAGRYGSVIRFCGGDPWDSLAPGLLDDLLGNAPRNLGVTVELHRVNRTALGLGSQVADIPEHL